MNITFPSLSKQQIQHTQQNDSKQENISDKRPFCERVLKAHATFNEKWIISSELLKFSD